MPADLDAVRSGMALARLDPDRGVPTTTAVLIANAADTGAVPLLASCDDQRRYWVKGPGNPHGNLCLTHEWVISELARRIGAPLPEGRLITVPGELVSGMRVAGALRRSGIWFGSSLVIGEERRELQFATKDGNPSRIPYYLALWHLCLGIDSQFVYEKNDHDRLWSIDHGLWFDNGEGDWTDLGGLDVYLDQKWAEPPWLGTRKIDGTALHQAAQAVLDLTAEELGEVTGSVPVDWQIHDQHLEELALFIFRRRELVADQLRARASHR